MQALYNTRNRSERIRFAQRKRKEGYSINDIALLLHSATTTISRYLAILEDEVPEAREKAMERKHIQQIQNKKTAIEEVRRLYADGHAAEEIKQLTGHTWQTVTNYLKENCSFNNGHYDRRLLEKLAPYEQDVIEMRSKGITYAKIHEYGLTPEQYEAALKKYPLPGQLYTLLKDFHRIVISGKSSELDQWLSSMIK